MMMRQIFSVLYFVLISLTVNAADQKKAGFDYEVVIDRDDVIWGLDFLPDGRVLFSERGGTLSILDPKTKALQKVANVPAVANRKQGGLLDVKVHPDFAKNATVFISYSEPKGDDDTTTSVISATLKNNSLENIKKIFSAKDIADTGMHFGSRIVFDGKGHVFISVGERNERDRAQDLKRHTGKIIRLNEDGSVPADNPFVGKKDALPEIWSYGHRNPQGLAYDSEKERLWEAEMGPRGGDEVNLVKKGANYGWPVITYGREYYGPKIGTTHKEGMEQPAVYWVPSISPSGLALYTGDKFPQWKGNLFLACLSGRELRRVVVNDAGKVTHQESLLKDKNTRFRAVRTGLDGNLWVTTDDGVIAKITPSK